MHYVIQCRFSEFLIQLCIKKRFSLGPSRYITTVRFFWGPCRNITDQEPGGAGVSCRTIFRVCEERLIFRGNIHLWTQSTQKYLKVPSSTYMYPEVPQCTQKYLKVRKSTSKVGFGHFCNWRTKFKFTTTKFQNSKWATKSALHRKHPDSSITAREKINKVTIII